MLHDPRPRPHRRGHHPRLLSVTLDDTLPKRKPHYRYEVAPGWWLIVAREGVDYDELGLSYINLPGWARSRMFVPAGVADPADDLAAYYRTRWWGPDWTISPTSVRLLEGAAPGLTPWRHAWLN